MEELGYLSEEPGFQRLIEARVGFLKDEQAFKEAGLEEGRIEGRKEGMRKKSIEIAKELLKEKMPVDKIARITGLTEEEIENLK